MILPSIFSPNLRGPRNQADKNHHKLKRYGLVFFVARKGFIS
jgi:hypothetical protein